MALCNKSSTYSFPFHFFTFHPFISRLTLSWHFLFIPLSFISVLSHSFPLIYIPFTSLLVSFITSSPSVPIPLQSCPSLVLSCASPGMSCLSLSCSFLIPSLPQFRLEIGFFLLNPRHWICSYHFMACHNWNRSQIA